MVLALASGCGTAASEASEPLPSEQPAPEQTEQLNPERRGIGALPLPEHTGPSALSTTIDPRRSLVVTDDAILGAFTFQDVMNQLVATSGVTPRAPATAKPSSMISSITARASGSAARAPYG